MYREAEFGTLQPLVFGHFGEVNRRFLELIDKLAEVVSFQHHRVHGWKNAKAGICRAKAGIMRKTFTLRKKQFSRAQVSVSAPSQAFIGVFVCFQNNT